MIGESCLVLVSCVVLGLVLVLIHRGPREALSDADVL